MIETGKKAPDFCLPDENDKQVCLKNFSGKWVVFYFYPKDNTSGCSREAQEFSAVKKDFEKAGAVILGCSKDSTKSHRNFIEKKELSVTLLSDPDIKVIEAYDAWREKKMYGKTFMGIVRSTVLINPDGKVAYHWPKVKVPGHVDEVLAKLKELSA